MTKKDDFYIIMIFVILPIILILCFYIGSEVIGFYIIPIFIPIPVIIIIIIK